MNIMTQPVSNKKQRFYGTYTSKVIFILVSKLL